MVKRKRTSDEPSFGVAAAGPPAKGPKPSRQAAARAAQQAQGPKALSEEARRELLLARLAALEADNFNEEERPPLDLEGSGLYADDTDVGAAAVATTTSSKSKKKKGAGKAAANSGAADTLRRLVNVRGALRKVDEVAAGEAGAATDEFGRLKRDRKQGGKPVFSEPATAAARADRPFEGGAGAGAGASAPTAVESITGNTAPWAAPSHHYLASLAPPARKPAVPFCGVCGARGKYSCVRCGARVCSKACTNSHSETRCMK